LLQKADFPPPVFLSSSRKEGCLSLSNIKAGLSTLFPLKKKRVKVISLSSPFDVNKDGLFG